MLQLWCDNQSYTNISGMAEIIENNALCAFLLMNRRPIISDCEVKVTDSCQTETSLPNTLQESQNDLDLSQDHDNTQGRQLVNVKGKSQTQVTPSRSTQFRRNKSALESKLINYMDSQIKQPSPVIQNQPKETDDLVFFRSLQTSLDTLTPNKKLNFRIDVMQLLTRYTNRKPNQDTPYFPNFTPAYQQAQQYPVANFPYTSFSALMPAQTP
ncbi:unnamed protein product [Psylliodes chrysocephalus]|uniref:BESS domain-containing protein n=1 Tax=Psylliodes chrysocephalus TaxID=3402493 RepID=A0A9P0D3P0_9CUCU|nr:unnamed protein product [Psylliodes chrysocephala]